MMAIFEPGFDVLNWTLLKVTGQNIDKPKRRQTETSTDQIVDKPKRRHSQTSVDQNVDKPNIDTPKRRQSNLVHCIVIHLFS